MSLDITAIESALRIARVPVEDRATLTEQVLTLGDIVIAELRIELESLEAASKAGSR